MSKTTITQADRLVLGDLIFNAVDAAIDMASDGSVEAATRFREAMTAQHEWLNERTETPEAETE